MGILFYELKHDLPTAEQWFSRALALDPNYQRAREYLSRIQTARPHFVMIGGDPDPAGGLVDELRSRGQRVAWIRHNFK